MVTTSSSSDPGSQCVSVLRWVGFWLPEVCARWMAARMPAKDFSPGTLDTAVCDMEWRIDQPYEEREEAGGCGTGGGPKQGQVRGWYRKGTGMLPVQAT